MVERFLRYSLERERKICVVFLIDGAMKKQNLRVAAIDADAMGFDAVFAGRKKPQHVRLSDVLTANYARGDQGELE